MVYGYIIFMGAQYKPIILKIQNSPMKVHRISAILAYGFMILGLYQIVLKYNLSLIDNFVFDHVFMLYIILLVVLYLKIGILRFSYNRHPMGWTSHSCLKLFILETNYQK